MHDEQVTEEVSYAPNICQGIERWQFFIRNVPPSYDKSRYSLIQHRTLLSIVPAPLFFSPHMSLPKNKVTTYCAPMAYGTAPLVPL